MIICGVNGQYLHSASFHFISCSNANDFGKAREQGVCARNRGMLGAFCLCSKYFYVLEFFLCCLNFALAVLAVHCNAERRICKTTVFLQAVMRLSGNSIYEGNVDHT